MRRLRIQRRPSPIRSTALAPALCVIVSLPGATSAQAIVAREEPATNGSASAQPAHGIPSNLTATPTLRQPIETMWRQSPTFKAQCARLRTAPSLVVEIRFGNPSQLAAGRARTEFVRSNDDRTRAKIYIDPRLRSLVDLVELIAHELEHVIEQLDEVELTAGERHGVYQTARGAFETARAIHIGRRVSTEVYRATNAGSRVGPRW